MHRRNFIRNSSLAGLALPAFSIEAKNKSDTAHHAELFPITNFELEEVTIDALQQKMQSGEISSYTLTEMYLQRIKEIDQSGPKLKSVIELNPDALAIANAMDAERKNGKLRSALHGIPVLLKDNIDTGDTMKTTAGTLALQNHIAKQDAFIIKKLREAGAVILAKTNLSEWANFRSSFSSSGYSDRGGQTKNPYILDRNPCGSSAGSGAAVSANLCVVAIGTETDGSIVCPASVCGIVGLKPTVGLLSRSGIIPISKTQDTAGPMARTVRDAAILLGALTGIDQKDIVTKESAGKSYADYTQFLNPGGLNGKRIGIDKDFKPGNLLIENVFKNNLDLMKKAGAEIVEVNLFEKINELGAKELDLLKYEFKDGVNNYLANASAEVKSLSDVIEFNTQHAEKTLHTFDQQLLIDSNNSGDLNSNEYQSIYKENHEDAKAYINTLLQENKLDALAGLTMGPACATDIIYGDKWGDIYFGVPAAITGFPHITVPCGMVYQLPIGLSFMSTAYSEPALLHIAFAFEQLSMKRDKPKFLSTL